MVYPVSYTHLLDTQQAPDKVLARIRKHLEPGAIILLHDRMPDSDQLVKQILDLGKRVESDYTFTADSETTKVEVAFTFDATSLDGKQLVTFEELYDLALFNKPVSESRWD